MPLHVQTANLDGASRVPFHSLIHSPISRVIRAADHLQNVGRRVDTLNLFPNTNRLYCVRFGARQRVATERWQSGRMRIIANDVTGSNWSAGSNPALSAPERPTALWSVSFYFTVDAFVCCPDTASIGCLSVKIGSRLCPYAAGSPDSGRRRGPAQSQTDGQSAGESGALPESPAAVRASAGCPHISRGQ